MEAGSERVSGKVRQETENRHPDEQLILSCQRDVHSQCLDAVHASVSWRVSSLRALVTAPHGRSNSH
jgi:hypothetical protein